MASLSPSFHRNGYPLVSPYIGYVNFSLLLQHGLGVSVSIFLGKTEHPFTIIVPREELHVTKLYICSYALQHFNLGETEYTTSGKIMKWDAGMSHQETRGCLHKDGNS